LLASDDFWPAVLESHELTLQWLEDGDVLRRPAFIERARAHGGVYIVKLEGVDDRNAAEDEVGGELFIDLDRLDVAPPDEERPFQVVGLTVVTEAGETVGEVTSLTYSAAHGVYEVRGDDGAVVLIPAVPQFIVRRDEERRELVVRPIPGLLDG
jgi:16S rRNA processing protein RimM